MKVDLGKRLYTFDLFDTLISRPVRRPAMVFDLMDDALVKYRFFIFRFVGFRRIRVLSERIARRMSSREDVSLFEIYRVVGFFVRNPASVLRREVAIELSLIEPLPSNILVLKDLLARGGNCLILSDMYLPAAIVSRIIKRHVDSCIDFLVSSREGITKASGGLFRKAADMYGVNLSDMQHFGDNPHSDYSMPRSLGVDAVKVTGLDVQGGREVIFDSFCLRGGSGFENVGFSFVGPLCYLFADFIARDAKKRGLKKIAFAARDGYLIKEAFDRLGTGIETF